MNASNKRGNGVSHLRIDDAWFTDELEAVKSDTTRVANQTAKQMLKATFHQAEPSGARSNTTPTMPADTPILSNWEIR